MPGHGKGLGDRSPSLSVWDGERAPVWDCHAGCDRKAIAEELKRRGLYAAGDGGERPARSSRPSQSTSERAGAAPDSEGITTAAGVTLAQLAEAKGLEVGFLRSLGLRDVRHAGRPAVAMPYRDPAGQVLFERRRVSLAGKRFHQPAGVSVAPYGLDRLEEARTAGRLTIVEGESDCWACWTTGEPALGLPGKGTWKPEFAAALAGIPELWVWQEPDAADLVARLRADLPDLRVIPAPDGIKDVAEAYAGGLHLPSFLATLRAVARHVPVVTGVTSRSSADEQGKAEDDRPVTADTTGGAAGADWPAPLAPEAFHGPAGRIVRAIEPTTESDPAAVLLQLLVFFGNAAGRQPHFVVEETRHGINEFLCLVGATSKARKGTAEDRVRALFRNVAEDWLVTRVQSGLSTGEGFIWEIRDPTYDDDGSLIDPGIADKRLLCVEGELATVLRRGERDGNSVTGELRLAWDGKPLGSLVKTRPGRTRDSHVSIVGHVTRDELTRYMTRTEAANGFGNRFLWTCVRRARELPLGGATPNLNASVQELHDALGFADELKWPMVFDESAKEAWMAVYGPLSAGKPGLVGAILGRAEAHTRRLACMYAVLDLSPVVALDHLMAALAVWDYCEASARYVFGESLGDPDADEVLQLLRAAPQGLTLNELHDATGRNWPSDRRARALRSLEENGQVRQEKEPATGRGRPAVRYLARNPRDRTSSYLALTQQAMGGYALNAFNAETPSGADFEFSDGIHRPRRGYAEIPEEERP